MRAEPAWSSRRVLVAVSDLQRWLAIGYVEVFRMAGAHRIEGEAAVIEWTGIGEAPWPE